MVLSCRLQNSWNRPLMKSRIPCITLSGHLHSGGFSACLQSDYNQTLSICKTHLNTIIHKPFQLPSTQHPYIIGNNKVAADNCKNSMIFKKIYHLDIIPPSMEIFLSFSTSGDICKVLYHHVTLACVAYLCIGGYIL